MRKERRWTNWYQAPVETRVEGEGDERRIVGHAAVFNVLSEGLGGFREQIAPGAFAASILEHDVRGLFNHDSNYVLARNRVSGSLRLWEDERGLGYEMKLNPDDPDAARVASMIARGDVSQNSFSFSLESREDQDWQESDEGLLRTLLKVRLYDVGPVTFPAYPQTEALVRSLGDVLEEGRECIGLSCPKDRAWELDLLERRHQLIGLLTGSASRA